MSRFQMSKLDIDVLVQLALVGPGDATNWNPLTDDPDRLGTLLWSHNTRWQQIPPMTGR